MEAQENDRAISLLLPAEPASVRAARQVVRRFAAEVGADADAVALAVSEAVTNAVEHAYPGGRGEICVRAGSNDDLRISVTDRGRGFAPKARTGRSHMGLPLIGHVADAVDVAAGRDGVEIEMRFARSA
jgi:serine/threonine-protein kinase RsbW